VRELEGEFKKVVEKEEKLSKDLVKTNSKWKNKVQDLEREKKNLKSIQNQVLRTLLGYVGVRLDKKGYFSRPFVPPYVYLRRPVHFDQKSKCYQYRCSAINIFVVNAKSSYLIVSLPLCPDCGMFQHRKADGRKDGNL
jgi:hypothetical protein